MSDQICNNKCGKKCGSWAYKGANNTYLCGGDWMKVSGVCGNNVCFKCGKVETRTEWIGDEDCCGNKIMREQKVSMFGQSERDENDPDRKLYAHYCKEHMEEAKKSPLKWTKADSERISRQEEQKKLEIEKKLDNQKGLFYVIDPFPRSVEWKKIKGVEYGCVYFWGKENGRNFYLLVPDTHPDLINLKRQFYLIEGIENLPLEANPYNCYEGNDPTAKASKFSKIVGLGDKIKIISADNQESPKKQKPVESNSDNRQNLTNLQPKQWNDKILFQYFQKHDIKSIKLESKNLIIEYSDLISTNPLTNFPELKGIDKYLHSKSEQTISRRELELSNNFHNINTKNPENNNLLISCIGGAIIIGGVIGLLLGKKRTKKH